MLFLINLAVFRICFLNQSSYFRRCISQASCLWRAFFSLILQLNRIWNGIMFRIHGASVAEMPLIATCSKYRRQGMCRYLMNAIDEMLRSIKVDKLVISAIPELVETWTEGFGFERLEDDERRRLRRTANLMVFPGTVWLKKSLCTSQVSKKQQIGSCSAPSSIKDDLGVSGSLFEGSQETQLAIKPEVDPSTEELDVKTELVPDHGNNIQIDKDKK